MSLLLVQEVLERRKNDARAGSKKTVCPQRRSRLVIYFLASTCNLLPRYEVRA